MLCDAYRVLTDPMTSYWRLEKALRFNKILNYYPIVTNEYIDIKLNNVKPDVMRFIRKHIIHNSKLIVIGFYAYDYYIKKVNNSEKEYPYYEVITTDLINDIRKAHKILKSKYSNITIKQFNPYFVLLDNYVEFYYNNQMILRIIGSNHRCTVYKFSKNKKTYYGTYNLTYMHLLFNYTHAIIFKTRNETFEKTFEKMVYLNMMNNIAYIRDKYLDEHKKTVIDKSPFQDFTFNCNGDPHDTIREAKLRMFAKKVSKFNYKPSNKKNIKVPNVIYDNNSGMEIIDSKKFFYKNI
jgi:hypothetical protein